MDALELGTRRRLWRIICAEPGMHLRQLQRHAGLGMGALEYHLGQLAKAGLVRVLEDGRKRVFPGEMVPADRRVMAFLRQEVPRRLLVAALAEGGVLRAGLHASLHLARSTLQYHEKRLLALGLLTVRGARLHATDSARVERLLVTYQATFMDRMVDAFVGGVDPIQGGRLPTAVPKTSS